MFIHVPRTGGTSVRQMWKQWDKGDRTHTTYPQLLKRFPKRNFHQYFKFGFIRNPWERVYSLYCKHVKNSPVDTSKGFKHWMFDETRTDSQRHKQSAMYFLNGVDYIAKYENFEQEWDYIFEKIDVPRVPVPLLNKFRSDSISYRDLYDEEMNDFITKYHQEDINRGEYQF
jgi:hypothetical protein